MINVYDTELKVETTYPDIEAFLEDCLTDEMVEEFLDCIYGDVEIVGKKFPTSKALRGCVSDDEWQLYKDDFQESERCCIEDDLASCGEMEFWQYKITDLDWKEN